jgi:hypothetical protein
MKTDELLVVSLAATRLRLELDNVPLWRGDFVGIKQLLEDFARYTYPACATAVCSLTPSPRDSVC